jgi:hypothetical protein
MLRGVTSHPRCEPREPRLGRAWATSLLLLSCVAHAPSRGGDAASEGSDTARGSTAQANAEAPAQASAQGSAASGDARGAPKYPATTVPLTRDSAYLRGAAGTDFWALAPYYVGQQDGVSCSLATLTMLVNAARRHTRLGADEPLVVQSLLRRRVNSPVWERGLAPGGEGVTLDELAVLAEQSLRALGSAPARVQVTHVPEASATALAGLREALRANEANGDDWLVVNFLAAAYVGVGDYGHIAPVGAYDARTRRVLILDPDREWYEPYWVPDEVVLAGMATPDSVTGEPRGYLQVSLEIARSSRAAAPGRR